MINTKRNGIMVHCDVHMPLVKTIIENIFPKAISGKIISSVRKYKKEKRERKRLSYGGGKPFVRNINTLGVSFKIVLDTTKNCYVDESIAEHGYWEMGLSRGFLEHIKKGGVFLDIGANIGYHSLFVASLLKESGRVYSFEPISHLCSQLQASIALNNFTNIEVCNFGLAESEGEATIHMRDENIGGSTLLSFPKIEKFDVKETEKVSLKKLDSFLGEHAKVDVIKIDVEGYELEALRGAVNILKSNHPVIFMEFSPVIYFQDYANKPLDLVDFLRGLGYSFFSLDEEPLDIEEWLKKGNNMHTQIDILCRVL